MTIAKKGGASNTGHKRVMTKKEKVVLTLVCIVLIIAIILVSIFMLYPKFAGRPDWQIIGALNFDDETWIEDMVSNRIKPLDKVLDLSSAFVYSEDTAFITASYGSKATIADAREYFLAQIPGAIDTDAGKASEIEIYGTLNGEDIEIRNYDADILNAFDTKITLEDDTADFIKEMLDKEFPYDFFVSYPEFQSIMQSDKLGGYVLYNDDDLSTYSYPGVPIYSQAYRYSKDKASLTQMQLAMKERYADSLYFEDVDTLYFMDKGHVFSLSITESDLNLLAVITVQEIPEEVLAQMQ